MRAFILAATMFGAAALPAQQAPASSQHHSRLARRNAALQAQAKITADSARAIALTTVPGGTVQSIELEKEKGVLIYSVDVKTAGKPGVDELWVDAATGKVVSHKHETPKEERAEARKDAKAAHKGMKKEEKREEKREEQHEKHTGATRKP